MRVCKKPASPPRLSLSTLACSAPVTLSFSNENVYNDIETSVCTSDWYGIKKKTAEGTYEWIPIIGDEKEVTDEDGVKRVEPEPEAELRGGPWKQSCEAPELPKRAERALQPFSPPQAQAAIET
ncbi:hypothetical protein NDU88_002895 [Pleurodeles waltl]|uniref:Uncharacterized protein n=1 Tax=Pleurodeles waltl TaxID=8319 RepID=A0AAV7T4P8_PLEWA|nr:hypothetical protein NDU88_002895 [Pleurodeles waltl]